MDAREILSKIIELSNASVDVDQRLSNLIRTLANLFAVPLCGLFLWDVHQRRLLLRFANRSHPALPPGASFTLNEGPLSTCALQKSPVVISDASQLSLWDPPISGRLSPFQFLACFPVADEIQSYGILVLLAEEPRTLSDTESELLPVICRQLAGTIHSAQIFQQAKKRIAELSTLHATSLAISSASDLGELLNRITLASTKILQADGSVLHLLDEESGMLKPVSTFGPEEGTGPMRPLALGEDAPGVVALKGEPILLPDAQAAPFPFSGLPREIASFLSVPLVFRARTIGTLTLYSIRREGPPEKAFDEEDRNLLSTMAAQIAAAIENAIILQRAELLAREKERMVRELSLLYDISRSMLTTIQLEQLLRIILLSITLRNCLGFDRAALFLLNEREDVLQGMMGIGPPSREDAERWRRIFEEKPFPFPDAAIPEEMENTEFDRRVRQARLPFSERHSILLKTLQEKRSFNIEHAATDPEVNPEVFELLGTPPAFASVPLIAKDRAIGVITVDNVFSGRPITPPDIGFLTMLANQAALAIENSRLYSNLQEINTQLLYTQNRLIQSEKLAALGEVVASITHEIKNPLVSIGGFARRLDRTLRENSTEKKYTRILLKEVQRLESILNDTLAFCRESSLPCERHDLNRIIEETLSILDNRFSERNITVSRDLEADLPPFPCDPQQMKQVFLNLFVNSLEAMGQDGRLSVRTSLKRQEGDRWLMVEVSDSGGGIPREILDNIFNPFFTTKQEGTGLGLAIAHKIITQHRGEIEVINRPGVGATFLVRLPLSIPSGQLKLVDVVS